MQQKTVDQMSIEELQDYMEQRRKDDVLRQKKAREEYEKFVDTTASGLVRSAITLSAILTEFHAEATEKLIAMRDKLNEYGAIRANSKGGFLLRTKDGKYKVLYKYASKYDWDERAKKAEDLLHDFLKDVVKKRDKDLFELLMGILEKNKEGKLELSRVQSLYSKEHLFSDPRWVEAIRLFKESFRFVDSKMRLEFYQRDEETNVFRPIPLNISSL